jgi:hypothetical protein
MDAERTPRRFLQSIFLVAVTAFLAHFARFQDFGLYADDYWAIAPYLGAPLDSREDGLHMTSAIGSLADRSIISFRLLSPQLVRESAA